TAQDNQPAVSIHVLQGEREFSNDNKTLGKFDLTGIAPAPRGVPQVEVTFDIDANGIINVSANDKATGKKQDIVITSGSGLNEEEIEKMVKEAEANREADQKRREVVDARNNLDSLVFATEKSLKDAGDKVPADKKSDVEAALTEAKSKLQSENLDEIKAATERLQNASHAIAQFLYQQPGAEGAAGGPEGAQDGGEQQEASSESESSQDQKDDDDVVDADFKEV
ncbi:MAG: Hsp70 family protein, partial [Bacteriovoracaceae bacterium]